MDFASLLTGASASSAGSSLASMLTGDSSSSLGAAVSGAATGSALGPLGAAAGAVLGVVGSLFKSGHAFDGAGMFKGLHSPTLPALDDSKMYKDDCQVFIDYAKGLGISVEEVSLLIHFDADHSSAAQQSGRAPFAYAFDAWRSVNISMAQGWVNGYNAANPLAMIHLGELGPRSAGDFTPSYTVGQSPGSELVSALVSPIAASASTTTTAASLTSTAAAAAGTTPLASSAAATTEAVPLWKQILSGALKGAQTGAGDAVAATPVGQQIKKDTINEYLQEYQLPIFIAIAFVVYVTWRAFKRR